MQEKRLAYIAFVVAGIALVLAWAIYAFVFSKRAPLVPLQVSTEVVE